MKEDDFLNQPAEEYEQTLADVSSKYNGPCSINDIEDMVKSMLATLPRINRDKLRKEMNNMNVPVFETPTTFDLNAGLAKVQGYKDRLVEIYMIAQRDYKLRKRCVEMLFDAFNVISKGASVDKRRGECIMKYPTLVLNVQASETFVEEIEQYLANFKSVGEVISRQITVMSMQLQLGEYSSRKGAKEYLKNNNNVQAEEIDYHSGVKKIKNDMEWGDI